MPESNALFWQLARWCAFVVERTKWTEGASDDPFDAPAMESATGVRTRRISSTVKDALSAAAAEGGVGQGQGDAVQGLPGLHQAGLRGLRILP